MAQSNSYPRDPVIKDKDVFSGTQFATLRTVNFTAQAVADYLNINGKVSIGGQMTFKFVTLTPGNGTISFPLGGGDNTPFSAITNLVVSTTDMSTQNVVNFLNYIVGSEILLTEQSHISTFGNYRITGYAITPNPNFYDLTLEYVGGFGNITQDLYYDLTFFRTEGSTPPVIPTKTSDLINDGEDGIHPFITAQDIPDALIFTSPLVDTAGTITINQSGLSSDGYLSSIDWNTFNDKQDALLGTGFVKSTAGVISYDTNTYYLASNPDGFITSAALTDYVPYTGATQAVNLGAYNLTVNNISVGKGSGTGTFNTAIGNNSLLNNTTGSGNSALGANSLQNNLAGNSNTAIGHQALYSNQGGGGNTAIGATALFSNTTGIFNSAIGVGTLVGSTTGSRNVALGFESGRTIADKATLVTIINNSILLGYRTSPLADNETNQIVIGYDAIGAGSNTVVLGNSSIVTTVLRGNVGVNTTTPISRLHISGPQATIRIDDTNSMDTLNSFQMVCRDYDDIQQMRFGFSTPLGAGAKTIMTLDQTGNVGINTTIPEQELHVVGNARVTGAIYDSNNEPGIMGQVLSSTVTGTDWVDIVDTGLTSVGLTMPVAFSVANSPLTSNGTIDVTAAGLSSQYIRGDGQLATFPTSGGGGSSVTYYLNGSIPSSVAGYQQMDNDAVIGLGTDFSLTGNGLIAQFLTDAGNPNRIEIPGGAWNFEMFFNISSVGGNTKFYIDLLKYDGTTFTLISSGSTNPEEITGGTSVDLYLTSLAVPTTPLLITDRLAIRVYIVDNSGGRTATLHTEDNNLCEIITTFSSGVASLNGLTASTQYFAVGTSGMDFNISSLADTHTFNLPTASAVNRGALSSADWSSFTSKIAGSGTVNYLPRFTGASTIGNSIVYDNGTNVGIGTTIPGKALEIASTGNNAGIRIRNNDVGSLATWNVGTDSAYGYGLNFGEAGVADGRLFIKPGGNVGIGTTNPTAKLQVEDVNKVFDGYGNINVFTTNTAAADIGGSIAFGGKNSSGGTSPYPFAKIQGIKEGSASNYNGALLLGTTANSSAVIERMRITSAGNLGIGTTNPTQKLEVNGNIFSNALNSTFEMGNGLTDSYGSIGFNNSNDSVEIKQKYLSGNITFFTNTISERMRITQAGNVGIGTTNPVFKLDISGNNNRIRVLGTTGHVALDLQNSANSFYVAREGSVGGNFVTGTIAYSGVLSVQGAYSMHLATNGAISTTITPSGNVGIGTTSPGYKLDVSGITRTSNDASNRGGTLISTKDIGGAVYLYNDNGSNTGAVRMMSSYLNGGTLYNPNFSIDRSTNSVAYGGNVEALTYVSSLVIDGSNGNVGIGTTSPTQKLDVVGGDALINSVKIGLGGGSIASNIMIGNSNTINTGVRNLFIGNGAGQSNTTAPNNSFAGYNSGLISTTGLNNSFFGAYTGYVNTLGSENAFFGYRSGYSNISASGNSFFGNLSGYNINGSFNTAIGNAAGRYISGGSVSNINSTNSIYLGAETKALADGQTNQIVIGYNATGLGSNTVVLGNDSIVTTALRGNVGIGTTSPSTKLDVNGVITATGGNSTSWNAKQDAITLTTTGTSGAATLVGSTLNIPQYSGGGSSLSGIHSFVKPEPGRSTGALILPTITVTASTASRLIVYPYIPAQSITCSSLYIVITTLIAGSNTRILIYSSLNGLPDTKLYESANLDSSTTGVKTAITTQTFNAGTTYWIGVHTSANQSMSAISLAGTLNISLSGASASNAVYITPSFGSAPTTFGTPTYFSGNVQLVGITI